MAKLVMNGGEPVLLIAIFLKTSIPLPADLPQTFKIHALIQGVQTVFELFDIFRISGLQYLNIEMRIQLFS